MKNLFKRPSPCVLIVVVAILVGVILYFSLNQKSGDIEALKEKVLNIANHPTVLTDAKSERLYKKALENALTERIEGTVSGIGYEIYIPKGYYATTTYKEIGSMKDREVTTIYRNIPTGGAKPYQDVLMSLYSLSYEGTDRQALIADETQKYTYQRGGVAAASSNYEFLGYNSTYDTEAGRSTVDQLISRASLGGEGGSGGDVYYVYNFSIQEPKAKILVMSSFIGNYDEASIAKEKTRLFFDVVGQLVVR